MTKVYQMKPFLLLTPVVLCQFNKAAPGSTEASQAAANAFRFIIEAPRNCLEAIADMKDSKNKNIAALWIRAAFHDAGTWNAETRTGGADASLTQFLNVPENAGFGNSLAPRFHQNSDFSKADSIALAAQVSVTHCGGPSMKFRTGRQDAQIPTSPHGLIPNGTMTLNAVRPMFARMGWTNEDIVALVTGSHSMGGVHGENSPDVTNKSFIPFDDTAGIFDNHVFKFTLRGNCAVQIDCDIANDPELRPIVQRYANDQNAFFEQYTKSFEKLLGQSSSELSEEQDLEISKHVGLFETEQPPIAFEVGPQGDSLTGTAQSVHRISLLAMFTSVVTILYL